jgi:hypothetical protein
MGDLHILRTAVQSDDPKVELAMRGYELDMAEARFRATSPDDEAAFSAVDDDLYDRRLAFREQLAKVTGMAIDDLERRLA